MFDIGREYHRRSEIYGEFGGQEQGGISTPAKHPYIFIFSGDSGEKYGYKDGWFDTERYRYTGQGQRGDMEFRAGNLAIRDHAENDKEIHLFEKTRKSYYRYEGQLKYIDHELVERVPDADHRLRTAIVFMLRRV